MHGNLYGPSRPAINRTAKNDSRSSDTATESVAKTGSDWFPAAAKVILGKDAGLHLHYITGFPERTCYRYASGESEPRDDFLRKLFHSPQGAPFHDAFMHGCDAPWWLDQQRERKLAAVTQRFIEEITKRE